MRGGGKLSVLGARSQIVVEPARPRAILPCEHVWVRRDGLAQAGKQRGAAFDPDQPVADHALKAVGDFLVLEMHQPLGVGAQRIGRIGRERAGLEHAQAGDREPFGARHDLLGRGIEKVPRGARAGIEQHRGDREIESARAFAAGEAHVTCAARSAHRSRAPTTKWRQRAWNGTLRSG